MFVRHPRLHPIGYLESIPKSLIRFVGPLLFPFPGLKDISKDRSKSLPKTEHPQFMRPRLRLCLRFPFICFMLLYVSLHPQKCTLKSAGTRLPDKIVRCPAATEVTSSLWHAAYFCREMVTRVSLFTVISLGVLHEVDSSEYTLNVAIMLMTPMCSWLRES